MASTPEWEVPDSEPALRPDADDEAFPFDGPVSWDVPAAAEPDESENSRAGAADEVADRMQHLAARIRRDGASAARSEMASDDRLTALLAALIAGYLEGREG